MWSFSQLYSPAIHLAFWHSNFHPLLRIIVDFSNKETNKTNEKHLSNDVWLFSKGKPSNTTLRLMTSVISLSM